MQKLIIIRGNSGSGKSTIARKLQCEMGEKTMLIPQDTVRRKMLRAADKDHNVSIQLIYDLTMYGKKIGYNVIVEGILNKSRYGDMLQKLMSDFGGKVCAYYFDLSFEETLRRHALRPYSNEFGEKEMKSWWTDNDYLTDNDRILTGEMSEGEIIKTILEDFS